MKALGEYVYPIARAIADIIDDRNRKIMKEGHYDITAIKGSSFERDINIDGTEFKVKVFYTMELIYSKEDEKLHRNIDIIGLQCQTGEILLHKNEIWYNALVELIKHYIYE